MANAVAMSSLLGSKSAVAARPAAFSGKARTARVQVKTQGTCVAVAVGTIQYCQGLPARLAPDCSINIGRPGPMDCGMFPQQDSDLCIMIYMLRNNGYHS